MKIGLALAGGGSLGAYQVGILKYLKEKNWHFDVVTGTSVGAINGALVVTDDIEELEKLWLEISNDKIMLDGMNLNKMFDIRTQYGKEFGQKVLMDRDLNNIKKRGQAFMRAELPIRKMRKVPLSAAVFFNKLQQSRGFE